MSFRFLAVKVKEKGSVNWSQLSTASRALSSRLCVSQEEWIFVHDFQLILIYEFRSFHANTERQKRHNRSVHILIRINKWLIVWFDKDPSADDRHASLFIVGIDYQSLDSVCFYWKLSIFSHITTLRSSDCHWRFLLSTQSSNISWGWSITRMVSGKWVSLMENNRTQFLFQWGHPRRLRYPSCWRHLLDSWSKYSLLVDLVHR